MQIITQYEMTEMYDEMLDELYGLIDICGYKYAASKAFEDVDPIAYSCGFNDFVSNNYIEHEDEKGNFDGYVEIEF